MKASQAPIFLCRRENLKMKKHLRMCLSVFLALDVILIALALFFYIQKEIPDHLMAYVGEEEEISLPSIFHTEEMMVEAFNVSNRNSGFSMISKETGNYQVSVKLFGVVPVKNVDVKVIQKKKLAPSGEPIGIYVETNGLLVLDTAEIQGKDGMTYAPGENLLRTGDYILQWNNRYVPTIKRLNEEIQKTKKKKVAITIRREKEEMKVAIKPILATDGTYKIGTWVREDTQGIGTLTYVTEDGKFGTLGHGISDADTGTLLDLNGGELYCTAIRDIVKGSEGEPGELQGYINMVATNQIGEIEKNTEEGVFGTLKEERKSEYEHSYLAIEMKQNIKKGRAYIYVNLEGTAKKYEIEIEEINYNSKDNKSFVIKVTDKKLLSLTGGIVQGMSGSPIIQDGKLIGAVTHVLLDDPTRGYGIFIENMLEH